MADTPHTATPWVNDSGHLRLCESTGRFEAHASGRTIAKFTRIDDLVFAHRAVNAHDDLVKALREWKCPGCGGRGTYQQDAAGRARNEERGKPHDPKYQPDPVTCKVCDGGGLHPTATAALVKAGIMDT